MSLCQDLDRKLNTLVLQSPAVSEETEKCKRYGCLETVDVMMSVLIFMYFLFCPLIMFFLLLYKNLQFTIDRLVWTVKIGYQKWNLETDH